MPLFHLKSDLLANTKRLYSEGELNKYHKDNMQHLCVFVCEIGDLDYSSVLLGMLVMQDVQLGLFIAVMPTLIQAQSGDLDRSVCLFVLCMCLLQTKHTHTHSCFKSVVPFCKTQLPVWKSPRPIPPGPGPGLSGCCTAAVFVTQIIPDWPLLQETTCREQRQQGDPGAGDGSFCLFHADSTHFAF